MRDESPCRVMYVHADELSRYWLERKEITALRRIRTLARSACTDDSYAVHTKQTLKNVSLEEKDKSTVPKLLGNNYLLLCKSPAV